MTFVIPDSKTTAADRLGYCVAAQEKLRRVHNEQSAKLKPQAMRQWIKGSFQPYSRQIIRELLTCRAEAQKALAEDAAGLALRDGSVVFPHGATWAEKLALTDVAVRQLADEDTSEKASVLPVRRHALKFAPPSEVLDEIVLPDLSARADEVDPYEDYTTYTETDPNNRFSVAENSIEVTALSQNEDAYVYDDKGAGHFTDFEHLVETNFDSFTGGDFPRLVVWGVANAIDDASGWATGLACYWLVYAGASNKRLYIEDTADGSKDYANSLSYPLWHYLTIDRSSSTITVYIRTGSHSGTLFDAISTSVSAATSYRYLYAASSWNVGNSRNITGDIRNLDLQEATTYDLTADDAAHAQSADSPTLEHVHDLAAAKATSAHAAETPALEHVHDLAAAKATHAHAAETPAVEHVHDLAAAEASSAHAAETPALEHVHDLVGAEATHAHAAETPVIALDAASLSADGAEHAHVAGSPALTRIYGLAGESCLHAHLSAATEGSGDYVRPPCWWPPGRDYPLLFPPQARSFLERHDLVRPLRLPGPRTGPYWWKLRRKPLVEPLPQPEHREAIQGEPVPDRGTTFAGPVPPFLARTGIIPGHQGPAPRVGPYWWKLRRLPLEAPLPLPEHQQVLQGEPVPDGGQTYDWPHPEFEQS